MGISSGVCGRSRTNNRSRLIVKNLPKYFTEDNLKDHFTKKYNDITDVKLMKGRNGESRRFAFLGFKNQEDAESAVKYFDNTFIHTLRILVQLAKSFADPTAPKPFKERMRERQRILEEKEERLKKRRLEAEERAKKKAKFSVTQQLDQEIESNPKLREYMEATKSSSKITSWDDGLMKNGGDEAAVSEVQKVDQESDDEYEEFGEKMVKLDEFRKPTDQTEPSEEHVSASVEKEEVSEQGADEKPDPNMSDLDWLRSKQKRMKEKEFREDEEESAEQPTEPIEEQPLAQVEEEKQITPEDEIRKTGRLFIRNILYTATEEEFRDLFLKYGALSEVHIAVDTRTHKSKGFVYIQFNNPENAVEAYRALDKQIFQGRLLHILPGQGKKSHKLDEFDLKNMPLKKQKELKRKFQASKDTFSWNSLFLNETAVLDAVADKMGIAKRDLIDPQSSSSAVKQALAEAHVIGDVRKYFESKGVDLTSFSGKEKDDKIILVKNFPYETTVDEIIEMFGAYGDLSRVLFPPTGSIAIVEFKDAPAARTAFTKLAYTRFKKSMLYLEKGPKNLFTKEAPEEKVVVPENTNVKEAKLKAEDLLEKEEEQEEEFVGITSSVFVKNLNFKTTSQDLTSLFKNHDGFIMAKVLTKPDTKNSGKTLSMGFGFVEFKEKEQALSFIKDFDGKVIDGHQILLKLSHRKNVVKGSTQAPKGKKSTKIIVKNLPFEATRKDVFELFKSFGQLKSVRVPKKFNKSARGFAFVEFNLLKEAEHAMDALKGVHLLGRRLNIDYAEKESDNAEEEIERMTQKMKRQKNLTDYAKAAKLNGKKRIELEDDEAEGF